MTFQSRQGPGNRLVHVDANTIAIHFSPSTMRSSPSNDHIASLRTPEHWAFHDIQQINKERRTSIRHHPTFYVPKTQPSPHLSVAHRQKSRSRYHYRIQICPSGLLSLINLLHI